MVQTTQAPTNGATATGGLPANVRSLKSVLRTYTVESLAADGTVFYFSDVTKGPSGRMTRDKTPEVAYDLTIMGADGERLGKVRTSRETIAAQLEAAGVVGEGPDEWLGPVRVVQSGRSYKLEPTD
jgi:hypothetical protein